jgi:hypothetical protein
MQFLPFLLVLLAVQAVEEPRSDACAGALLVPPAAHAAHTPVVEAPDGAAPRASRARPWRPPARARAPRGRAPRASCST